MAGKNIEELALALAEDTAREQGVYIVDVSYTDGVLCYYIDKDGGVGIDDCESFSRAVEPVLDKEDPIPDGYSLDVSSPGVDRKLKKEREFMYYLGREVEVKLFAARDGVKEFDGILKDYRDKTAVIDTDDGIVEIPIKQAAYIRLKFVF
ncbi:MAG: ribosome maturation factor RimP [Clostridia bacterium]|nr:ribosome maturation factor RimP [Clostridia bacterium]